MTTTFEKNTAAVSETSEVFEPIVGVTKEASHPPWFQDAVLYQVHVKSFFDSSGDGMGDLPGLTQKLDYLQELGVTCIWLQPFYPSPMRDDGYDIADFRGVHSAYGTMEDFQRFVQEAHKRGLRIVPEVVLSHTSDQHPWFQAARRAPPTSPLRHFYVWRDSTSLIGPSNWSWDPVAQAYYRHRFFEHQPDLNYDHPPVRQEMLRIMKFWLDHGVDGLCVGAWPPHPYPPPPVEGGQGGGEGENIHGLLKEVRREMDARSGQLLLLAAVNRWPAEVRSYFGEDNDECHMALHFSLMPRLFMALRQEDRHAISEIMSETNAIPEKCRWALFLRNHDELTLTLVSEEERDYMYKEYAADPQMRLNVGIRRRLAPLLENSRARIELLNSLLFSLPGTPVIYYGDEIGMGDNVYLGDRQGVRTPMQWTGERNAGFSQADFARLYSSPNTDPVYGFPAVNVESQRRDPSSLLNWTRRLIGQYKRLPTLTQGNLEFLSPQNHKVLAYVRRHREDVFLGLANLSRVFQPVELDLARFAGMIPVEVFGRTELPRIGAGHYLFTLGPYGFYWFQLQRSVEKIAVRFVPVAIEEFKEVPLLKVAEGWESLFHGPARAGLEQIIPKFLLGQRWFGGKARAAKTARIVDWAQFPTGPDPASATGQVSLFWTMVEVAFQDGASDLYSLPVGVIEGTGSAEVLAHFKGHVLARLSGPQGEGLLVDALVDEAACETILRAIAGQREIATRGGLIRAMPTSAFASLCGSAPLKPRPGPATSSNSLVAYGRKLLLKLFRRLDAGTNPDLEIGRFLTEKTCFRGIPVTAGSIEYLQGGAEPVTLALLQQLVPNQGDGWHHAIDELERYFERACLRLQESDLINLNGSSWLELADSDPDPGVLELIGLYWHVAAMLGRRTAELHLALAQDNGEPAFAPEPMSGRDLAAWVAEADAQAHKALAALRANLGQLPESLRHQGNRVVSEAAGLLDRLALLPATIPPTTGLPLLKGGMKERWGEGREGAGDWVRLAKIRCHGDYHLGQVLRVQNDFVILDFEGEPARSISQRRAKHSPLKDVAGMLRSFSYAAYGGLFAFTHHHAVSPEQLVPWAELWQRWISAAFLREYRATAGGANFIPAEPGKFSMLLRFFTLDKAFYELTYELNNRPDWVRIPLQGILSRYS